MVKYKLRSGYFNRKIFNKNPYYFGGSFKTKTSAKKHIERRKKSHGKLPYQRRLIKIGKRWVVYEFTGRRKR